MIRKISVFLLVVLISLSLSCDPSGGGASNVILSRIDVYLSVANPQAGTSGTFTIQIRDAAGTEPSIWENTVSADDLSVGGFWNSFAVTGCTLTKNTMYRIYITRSGTNIPNVDSITWRANDSDVYTPGISSVSATTDFMFKTYDDDGILEQQMITENEGYVVWNTFYWWQEFVTGAE